MTDRWEVTEYEHSGHPETAGQYSQGTFRTGRFVADADRNDELSDMKQSLRQEGIAVTDALADRAGGLTGSRIRKDGLYVSWEVTEDEDGATLTVSRTCAADDHDGEGCTCWEYVHSFGLVEA